MISSQHQSSFAHNMSKSMTIEEMRELHQQTLNEAEAKRTELRLVLASRYRELVGSSDDVIKMKERSQELHDLVNALPTLMEKLFQPAADSPEEISSTAMEGSRTETITDIQLRRDLSSMPRLIYRLLDNSDVHGAAVRLIELFTIIASRTNAYPLANQLASPSPASVPDSANVDSMIKAQLKMTYLQMMTLPDKITRIAKRNLLCSTAFGNNVMDSFAAAERSAAALAAIDLLSHGGKSSCNRAVSLLEIYFDSKAKLLMNQLEKLAVKNASDGDEGDQSLDADVLLSRIVAILQYDIILHSHAIFCERGFASSTTLPEFDPLLVRAKVSKFLAGMIPLIRTKAKAVLVNIAGTTAAALGQIRQSLYDKTDGAELTKSSKWIASASDLVDTRAVFLGDYASSDIQERQFSLWSALFSTTFSSLVNSLLSTAFGSVHFNVIATLTASLSNAPSFDSIQPHEAYRNTLKMAVDLDHALLKVSEDAHELLVHAEEREESERRLGQSLYVQTCEILGRLVHELRRIAISKSDDDADATKAYIIGRLCFLLKFRLTALPKLLNPCSSPAAMGQTAGMIELVDLQSAFDLADDDEDGAIEIAEAFEAVNSAFSGTQFRGADMLRETLLLESDGTTSGGRVEVNDERAVTLDVTIQELTLLSARGLRHEGTGPGSALGTLQSSLDALVSQCFLDWAKHVSGDCLRRFHSSMSTYVHDACTSSEVEWKRLHASTGSPCGVSPHVVALVLDLATVLNRAVCPSDSISPLPSRSHAHALGLPVGDDKIPTIIDSFRQSVVYQSALSIAVTLEGHLQTSVDRMGKPAAAQLTADLAFVKACFVKRDRLASPNLTGKGIVGLDHVLTDFARVSGPATPHADAQLKKVLLGSGLSLSSILGLPASSDVGEIELEEDSSTKPASLRMPMVSSVRFNVLAIQADRSLNEIQLRGKFAKEKETSRTESIGGSVMSSGLGFMSSGLGFFKKT
jgi:hypothetical protein